MRISVAPCRCLPWRLTAAAAGLTLLQLAVYALLARGALGTAMCQWDCGWYISIASHGYDSAPYLVGGFMQANWAFFPLFPALIAVLHAAIGSSAEISGIIVSSVCFAGLVVLGARYRSVTRQDGSPWPWLLLLVTWPYGLYFHAAYSEALYAMLAIAALLGLARGRPLAAAAATALLTATRPTGVLLAAWIGLDALRRIGTTGLNRQTWRCLLPAAIAPLGLGAFMALLYLRAGDPLAFVHIQAGWSHATRNPVAAWLDLYHQFELARHHLGPAYFTLWALLGLAAAAWLAAKRHFAEAWLAAGTVLMALGTGAFGSLPRYVAASPTFLLAVADGLQAIRWPLLRYLAFLAFAAIQLGFVLAWLRGASFLL